MGGRRDAGTFLREGASLWVKHSSSGPPVGSTRLQPGSRPERLWACGGPGRRRLAGSGRSALALLEGEGRGERTPLSKQVAEPSRHSPA